ncbi:hypothetical protein ACFY93_08765 [Streptomyces sp. NPDC008313]|uniref:hypothetical protein n=1 Tax=Streptomyces sp. NPDC008313 TaxID=3364826 RepID=UPI0036EE3216
MKAQKIKRIVATASVVAAVGVVPLVTATPASASQSACANYIGSKGYAVGPKVKAACSYRAIYTPIGADAPNPFCVMALENIRVKPSHATAACQRA